jgi:hypothetical protein
MIDDETKALRNKIAVLETQVERARVFAEFFLDEFRFEADALADWAAQGDNDIDDLVVWAKELRK